MTIATLLPLLITILGDVTSPQGIEAIKGIWKLATQTTAPTPIEQADYDAAEQAAYDALQKS